MNHPKRCPTIYFILVLVSLFGGCSHSGETIVLRFVDEAGKPVADVQNRIYGADYPKNIVLNSDQNGIVTIDFATIEIETKNKSFQTYTWHPDYVNLRCSFGSWGIEPTPKKFTFRLERGREVGGVIVDEYGEPVKGAIVRLHFKDGEPDSHIWPHPSGLSQEPTTDDEGRWTATQVPTKKFYPLFLFVTASGFAPKRVGVELEDESFQSLLDKSHRTVLSPGLTLTGKLVAEGDADLERTVLRFSGPFHFMTKIDVSKAGDFQLNDLVAGEYTLQIIPENHAPTVFSTTLSAGSPPLEIPLKHGKPIRFRVTDTEGKPLAGIEMRRFYPNAPDAVDSFFSDLEHVIKATDAEGRTVWHNALDEPCSYAFYHNNDNLFSVVPDLMPREEEYPILMCRKLTVRGTVVDAKTKKAVPMFWASVVGWDESQKDEEHAGWWLPVGGVFPYVKGDISYTIEPTRFAERCRVQIGAEGYEPGISEEFSLKDGDREFHFELKKAAKTKP